VETVQKGKIIENLLASEIIMRSNGGLLVFRPMVDLGLDFIIVKRGKYNPIYLQIKGRQYKDTDHFSRFWRKTTMDIIPNERFYLVFCRYDFVNALIKKIWFMPSKDFIEEKYQKSHVDQYEVTLDKLVQKLEGLTEG